MTADGRHPKRSVGWRCAQRRPLRALAHTLRLYDPDYVFLGDDDTYVNYPLLASVTTRRRAADMHNALISYGNMCTRYMTPRGFMYGGSGYFFGRKVITSLVGNRILKDFYFAPKNMSKTLSLYHSMIRYKQLHRDKDNDPSRAEANNSYTSSNRKEGTYTVRKRYTVQCSRGS